MLTLFAIYMLAIAFGAGASFIFDFFFISSLKNHKLSSFEQKILRHLNSLQFILIIWIMVVEIVYLAIGMQYFSFSEIAGMAIAKLVIEVVALFCIMFLRKVHLPALIRHQVHYHHLSESFLEHSNTLIGTAAISLSSWSFILLITSGEINALVEDFGFLPTLFSYAIITFIFTLLVISMKNAFLKGRKRSIHHKKA